MRVGVVGVGRHASGNLYPNLAPAGLDLVAACARHRERAQAAATRWGAPHAFDSVSEMLGSVELDGVVVCVPPASYAEVVIACLEAGTPVFCEKPAAASSDEARQLASLAADRGVPVVVGYMKRFAPAYRKAREIVRSGEFGQPSLGAFTFAMGPWTNDDLRDYLIDNPVHHLDIARYLLGEVSDLDGRLMELDGVRHAVCAVGRTGSGAVCSFNFCTTASWAQRNECVEVYGGGHAVSVENVDTCTHRPPERPRQVWQPNYTVPWGDTASSVMMGFVPALEHFRDVVLDGAENVSDMASAAATLALAERLCEIAGV
jgi:UDP-N-acetylglucosamine 3-dehydrogenase